ncbi:MAG: hypothetical protein QOJ50_1507 [Cryptosporangiaceae bacterium]|nr:hypothetical protein [Cryptosporangiaceae bacterium]
MADHDKIPLIGVALLLTWLAFRAGTRTQRSNATWNDHRDMRAKTNLLQKLRWNHLGWAVLGWAVLIAVLLAVVAGH